MQRQHIYNLHIQITSNGEYNDPVLWLVFGVSSVAINSADVLSCSSSEKVVATLYTAQLSNEVVSWGA